MKKLLKKTGALEIAREIEPIRVICKPLPFPIAIFVV